MISSAAEQLGIGDREVVALVGAGGKTTLLLRLARELADRGARVLLTTTTKLGSDQTRAFPSLAGSAAPAEVDARLRSDPGPLVLIAADDGHKVTGPPPDALDRIYAETSVDYVLIEADGARRRPFKAPGAHEPVVPDGATLVVIVMGMDAIGRRIDDVCHRPERVAALAGCDRGDVLDVPAALRVLAHPDGFLESVPQRAQVAVAITKVLPTSRGQADRLARLLPASAPRIGRVAILDAGG